MKPCLTRTHAPAFSSPWLGTIAASLLALFVCAGASARNAAEDKIPGFEHYIPVEITSIYWKDKHWEKRDTLTPDILPGFKAAPEPRCEYGGLAAQKIAEATGFFHAAKQDGRWTLVDPDGHRFITLGMDSTSPNKTKGGAQALKAKYGDEAGWAKATLKDLKEMGFNTLGCWSDFETFKQAGCKIPYTVQLNWMQGYGKKRGGTFTQPGHTGYPGDCIFVFDEQFESYCNEMAQKLIENKNDPWLFGYFSDNEMPLKKNALDNYFKLPENDPGHKAAKAWLIEHKGAADLKGVTDADRSEFLALVAARYYRTVYTAIKKHDPNHLYLGSRFYSMERDDPKVMAAVGPYVDVAAFNYYNAWTPDYKKTHMWAAALRKPYIITEFYAKGMDSGMSNTGGAGWTVRTQKDRGLFYQNFCLGLLNDPGCVGWHYFKYLDNDPTDKKTDPSNRDSNKGYMNARYEPWMPVMEAMKQLNTNAYELRDYLLGRQKK